MNILFGFGSNKNSARCQEHASFLKAYLPARLRIRVKALEEEHIVSVGKVLSGLDGGARSPSELVKEESVEGTPQKMSRGRNRIVRAAAEVRYARQRDIIERLGKGGLQCPFS